jgi:hypothetical protein
MSAHADRDTVTQTLRHRNSQRHDNVHARHMKTYSIRIPIYNLQSTIYNIQYMKTYNTNLVNFDRDVKLKQSTCTVQENITCNRS